MFMTLQDISGIYSSSWHFQPRSFAELETVLTSDDPPENVDTDASGPPMARDLCLRHVVIFSFSQVSALVPPHFMVFELFLMYIE